VFSPRHLQINFLSRTPRFGQVLCRAPRVAKKVSLDQQFLVLAQRAIALLESVPATEPDALDPTTRLIAADVHQGARKPFLTVFAEDSQATPREKKAVMDLFSRFVQLLHLRWLAIRLYGNFDFTVQANESNRQAILTARKACLKPFPRIGTADQTLRSLDLTLLMRAATTGMGDLQKLFEKNFFKVRDPNLEPVLRNVFESIKR